MELLPTAMGGRSGPTFGSYRPDHNFGDENNRSLFSGFFEIPADEKFYPGDARELVVTFREGALVAKRLSLGARWRIQEGLRLVGYGTALAFL